jgi:hypothetical protein
MLSKPGGQLRWLRPLLIVPAICVATAAGASMTELVPESMSFRQWVGLSDSESSPEETQIRNRVGKTTSANDIVTDPGPPQVNEAAPEPEMAVEEPANRKQSARVGALRTQKTATDPEALLMLEAMRARNSGDSLRAEQLASVYRKKYPRGALGEEALVLAFEAAASRQGADAEKLARQYLRQFPDGRFRDRAHRVIAGSQR